MRKLLVVLGAVVTLGLLGGGVAQATSNMNGNENARLASNETVDASYYAAGKTVLIEGTVKGDVYCAGQNIEVKGVIEGDVICAGQEVRIGGIVKGDVRVAGQNVFLDGTVAKSVSAFGQVVVMESQIGQDVTIGAQTTRLAGMVARDVTIGAQQTTLEGTVKRNVHASVDFLTLRDKAQIGGNLTYVSDNEADRLNGAVVTGQTERQTPPKEESADPVTPYNWAMGLIMAFLFLLPLAIVWLALMPRVAAVTATTMRHRFFLSIGLGLLALVVAPLLAMVIMFTVIGIPLGLVMLFFWFLAVPAGFIMSAYSLGHWVTEKLDWRFRGHEFVGLVLGLFALVFAVAVPYVGWLIAVVAIASGVGTQLLLKQRFIARQYDKPSSKKKSTKEA